MYYTIHKFPKFGNLLFLGDLDGLQRISYVKDNERLAVGFDWHKNDEFFEDVIGSFEKYFSGELKEFDVDVNFVGTDFQKAVWRELLKIPYGETASYGEIAMNIDNPSAVRAVGTAVGSNPLLVVVPCHRVISGDGSIGGFGCGIDKKKILHEIESIRLLK